MAGKSNTSATFFAQKKLLGKAHTSNLKTDGEELIGSNVQAATSLIFGEKIPTSPTKTDYLISSASADDSGTVEYITFALTAITGTTYDADSSGGGAGSDSGEGSQASGPHAYKFVLPTDYVASSSNTRKGNGVFNNGRILHESLGKIQLIPPFFSQDTPNPYIIKIYKDDGSGGVGSEIPLLDNIDWNVDFYNGVLFLQDYVASKIPAHARGFIYVGKMADEVISSGSSAGGGGSADDGASYIVQAGTGSLSSERTLVAGTGIKSVDGGANSNFTLNVDNSVVATLTGSQFTGNVGITGSLGVRSDLLVANKIQHIGDTDTSIQFEDDTVQIIAGDKTGLKISEGSSDKVFIAGAGSSNKYDQVLILSGGAVSSFDEASGDDVAFYVSGAIGSKGTADRGTAVFGGDVVVSGTIKATSVTSGKEMVFNEKLSGTADGSNTAFSLGSTPFNTSEISVFVNGQLQVPSGIHVFQDYSVTGSSINFSTASRPPEGSIVMAIYNKVT